MRRHSVSKLAIAAQLDACQPAAAHAHSQSPLRSSPTRPTHLIEGRRLLLVLLLVVIVAHIARLARARLVRHGRLLAAFKPFSFLCSQQRPPTPVLNMMCMCERQEESFERVRSIDRSIVPDSPRSSFQPSTRLPRGPSLTRLGVPRAVMHDASRSKGRSKKSGVGEGVMMLKPMKPVKPSKAYSRAISGLCMRVCAAAKSRTPGTRRRTQSIDCPPHHASQAGEESQEEHPSSSTAPATAASFQLLGAPSIVSIHPPQLLRCLPSSASSLMRRRQRSCSSSNGRTAGKASTRRRRRAEPAGSNRSC